MKSNTIRSILNKIIWTHTREDLEKYFVAITDRSWGDNERYIPLSAIESINRHYIYVREENKFVPIPIHRIKKIVRIDRGEIIWSRYDSDST